ncbi:VOC family protein, partial [Candidatus Gottesmanbacteria bacterium]|nr:VOC family protein [Candidatus Gottesmanbacteria bacterium]
DTGVLFGFDGKETDLWIGQHDEVHGKSKDIYRHMINLKVDSVGKVYEYLVKKGVKFEAKPFKAPKLPYYFATFYDPENNILQLIGGK